MVCECLWVDQIHAPIPALLSVNLVVSNPETWLWEGHAQTEVCLAEECLRAGGAGHVLLMRKRQSENAQNLLRTAGTMVPYSGFSTSSG